MHDLARQAFLRKIDYQFQDNSLFELALTHRSASSRHNERLEFLGDALLNQFVAIALYSHFPKASEGEMSRMRAQLVKEKTLAEIAQELHLGQILNLGPGELKSGGFRRESILADALEALFAAIYLDRGMEACESVVLRLLDTRLHALSQDNNEKDAKTRLQEHLQAKHQALPLYELLETRGEAHAQEFTVSCQLPSGMSSVGIGSSRRRAEQQAAEQVLQQLLTQIAETKAERTQQKRKSEQ